jgi:hypothetical protein
MRILAAFLLSLPLLAGGAGTVLFRNQTFLAEVASAPKEQEMGLMHRSHLAKDRCMIFLYGRDGYHTIWMRNCLISLDVAWVDAQGVVVEVAENVPPCSKQQSKLEPCPCATYGGTVPARHFIEFPAGTFKRLKLKKGDAVRWDLVLDDGTKVKGGAWAMMAVR